MIKHKQPLNDVTLIQKQTITVIHKHRSWQKHSEMEEGTHITAKWNVHAPIDRPWGSKRLERRRSLWRADDSRVRRSIAKAVTLKYTTANCYVLVCILYYRLRDVGKKTGLKLYLVHSYVGNVTYDL